eukprot:469350-Rhodomonas_salina.1
MKVVESGRVGETWMRESRCLAPRPSRRYPRACTGSRHERQHSQRLKEDSMIGCRPVSASVQRPR